MRPMRCVTPLSGLVLVTLSHVAWAGGAIGGIGGFQPPDLCVVINSCTPSISVGPEPTSLALVAAGIGGLAWAKFRRRK
jgi:hypothetical protein